MGFLLRLDQTAVIAANAFLVHHSAATTVVKVLAVDAIYAVPVLWLIWWFISGQKQREYLLSALLAGLIAWQVLGTVWKLFIPRPRPDESLAVRELFFRRPDSSFPSDHAALLSGIAFFFWLKGARVTAGWLGALAVAVSAARVAAAAHYPSDVLVGFLDGFLAAWAVNFFHRFLTETVWARLIGLARKINLA